MADGALPEPVQAFHTLSTRIRDGEKGCDYLCARRCPMAAKPC